MVFGNTGNEVISESEVSSETKDELNKQKNKVEGNNVPVKNPDVPMSKENLEMNKEINKARLEKNFSVNGQKITISEMSVAEDAADAANKINNPYYKIKYDLMVEGKLQSFTSRCTIINTINNSWIKAYDFKSGNEKVFNNTIYDLNVPKEKSKTINIRIEKNEGKTKEIKEKTIQEYLFSNATNLEKNPVLENTQITDLNSVFLGKEPITAADGSTKRELRINSKGESISLGAVSFKAPSYNETTKTWETSIDTDKSDKEIKVLDTKLPLNLSDKEFTLGNTDTLVSKIKEQRASIKTLVEKAGTADQTLFPGLSKLGNDWSKTKNIVLDLAHNQYKLVFDDAKDPTTSKQFILIGFDAAGKPELRDTYAKSLNETKLSAGDQPYTLHIREDKLSFSVSEKGKEQTALVSKVPELEGQAPEALSTSLLGTDESTIQYLNKEGKVLSKIPCTLDNGVASLGSLSTDINTRTLFENFGKNIASTHIPKEVLAESYNTLLNASGISLSGRPCVAVQEGQTTNYYTIKQKKPGEALVWEHDEQLSQKAKEVSETLKNKVEVINKLASMKLDVNTGKKVGDLTQNIGNVGFAALDAAQVKNYLASSEKEVPFTRELFWGEKETPETLSFTLTDKKISLNKADKKKITLENQTYEPMLVAGKVVTDPYELVFYQLSQKAE